MSVRAEFEIMSPKAPRMMQLLQTKYMQLNIKINLFYTYLILQT